MKLFAGIAVSVSLLLGSEELKRPDPFFVKGNKFYYTYTNNPKEGKGSRLQSRIEITTVNTQGKSVSSEGVLVYGLATGGTELLYKVRFACDSLNFYVSTTNWLYEPVKPMDDVEIKVSGDSLWYPLNMKVGDTLPSASATQKYASSYTKDSYTASFQNRKVEELDSISTPFGMQLAFRIEMDVKYNSVYDSQEVKGRRKDEMKVTEWFVPSIGVVKSEYHDASAGVSRIVMERYKDH